jgi:replicative DNA helicase
VQENLAEIIVAKHRNGPTGDVQLIFQKNLAKFMNAAHERRSLADLS